MEDVSEKGWYRSSSNVYLDDGSVGAGDGQSRTVFLTMRFWDAGMTSHN